MRLRIYLIALGTALCAAGQGPDAVARIREAALSYGDRLQNFTCIQITARSTGPASTGTNWRPLDTQESELNYVDHREHYRPLRVNGQTGEPAELERMLKSGYFRGSGQFGSALEKIFNPKANAAFEWDRAVGTCVLAYRVAVSDSAIELSVNGKAVRMGHHGTVWADCATGAVERFFTETDAASVRIHGLPVAVGYRLEVQYGPVTIGDREFLLPVRAVQTAQYHKTWTRAEMRFERYGKYDASSTVTFDKER